MSFKIVGMLVGFFLLASVFASSFVAAGDVILKTAPAQNVWRADGVTEYRVDVYADNTGLNGESTRGIEWALVAPSALAPYLSMTRAEWPVSGDFFAGYSTFWSSLGLNWNLHGKLVSGSGPSNRQGVVASYWFKVSTAAPVGWNSFSVNDVNAYSPSLDTQPLSVQHEDFKIIGPRMKDVSLSSGCSGPSC